MPQAGEDQQPTLRPTLRLLAARHPVAAFLVMAYAFAWASLLPALLSEQGFGLLPVSAPVQPSVLLSSVLGLTLPAFLVTAARDGKAGVRDLLRRCLRWRVGVRWYLLALFGLLVATLLGAGAFLGAAAFGTIVHNWRSLFSTYLPGLLVLFVLGNMWEEIGYTGFLQDTLQERHGPLLAGVMVAPAFALMHLPALFVSGWVLDKGLSLAQFPDALFTVGVLAVLAVFFRTLTGWLYNGAGRSVLVAGLFHSAFNMTVGDRFVPGFIPGASSIPTVAVLALAVLVAVFTMGRLAYEPRSAARFGRVAEI